MLSPSSSKTPSLRLPFQYICLGLVFLVISQILMLKAGPLLLEGNIRTPYIWILSHMLIVGWASMVVMGAMYQLVPVAFLVPIFSERIGYIQFYLMTLSLLGFIAGFWFMNKSCLLVSGIFLVIGFILFIFNMGASFKKIEQWTMISKTVFSAIVYLGLTILLGLILVLQLTIGILPGSWHTPILYSHITFGMIGWFSFLIFGFSYKMVPMFSLAHDFSMKMSTYTFYLFHIGILSLVSSYWLESSVLLFSGAMFLFIAFVFFTILVGNILKHRMKRNLDKGFTFSLLSILIGLVVHSLFAVSLRFFLNNTPLSIQWMISLGYLYIMLWITLSIAGYLYKIIPFLWWTKKYSHLAGKMKVPMLKDFVSDRAVSVILTGMTISILGVASGIFLGTMSLFYISQTSLIMFTFAFVYSLFMIFKK
jgi:hypothetical protein